MAKMYAWSPIHYHKDDKSGLKIVKAGEEVTKDKIGVDDDSWNEMIEGGSVRPTPWPEGLDPSNPNALSPNEHRLRELRLQREKLEAEIAGLGGSSAPAPASAEEEEEEDNNQQTSVFPNS